MLKNKASIQNSKFIEKRTIPLYLKFTKKEEKDVLIGSRIINSIVLSWDIVENVKKEIIKFLRHYN